TIKINIYGILAARNAGIPIICNVSGLGTVFLWKGLVSYVARILYRLTFSRASFVFFQNEEDKDLFLKTIALPETKVGLLPGSGINLMEYSVQPYQPGPNPIFLMIARVLEDKGVREFVGAARQVHQLFPNCVFRLVGGMDEPHPRGIKQREVDEWVQQGWIQYGGHTDEVAGEIGRADVIVLPSYREGTPRSLLEGAAMGRALIATDVPGCHQVVKNNYNGLLCAPYSAESLAGAILQYCGMNDQEKIEMARNSRTFVEQFFDEKLVIGLYQQKIRELTFIEQ
ncbi:MAG: glycosyltransferase family 4 protein, partial [Cyclobacteriaceae bacterium]|nr:glycosyltransferase family 4 protein [Cyclobacteriaceae bacterium]